MGMRNPVAHRKLLSPLRKCDNKVEIVEVCSTLQIRDWLKSESLESFRIGGLKDCLRIYGKGRLFCFCISVSKDVQNEMLRLSRMHT